MIHSDIAWLAVSLQLCYANVCWVCWLCTISFPFSMATCNGIWKSGNGTWVELGRGMGVGVSTSRSRAREQTPVVVGKYGDSFRKVSVRGCPSPPWIAEECCSDYDLQPRGHGTASGADHRRPGPAGKGACQGDEVIGNLEQRLINTMSDTILDTTWGISVSISYQRWLLLHVYHMHALR